MIGYHIIGKCNYPLSSDLVPNVVEGKGYDVAATPRRSVCSESNNL